MRPDLDCGLGTPPRCGPHARERAGIGFVHRCGRRLGCHNRRLDPYDDQPDPGSPNVLGSLILDPSPLVSAQSNCTRSATTTWTPSRRRTGSVRPADPPAAVALLVCVPLRTRRGNSDDTAVLSWAFRRLARVRIGARTSSGCPTPIWTARWWWHRRSGPVADRAAGREGPGDLHGRPAVPACAQDRVPPDGQASQHSRTRERERASPLPAVPPTRVQGALCTSPPAAVPQTPQVSWWHASAQFERAPPEPPPSGQRHDELAAAAHAHLAQLPESASWSARGGVDDPHHGEEPGSPWCRLPERLIRGHPAGQDTASMGASEYVDPQLRPGRKSITVLRPLRRQVELAIHQRPPARGAIRQEHPELTLSIFALVPVYWRCPPAKRIPFLMNPDSSTDPPPARVTKPVEHIRACHRGLTRRPSPRCAAATAPHPETPRQRARPTSNSSYAADQPAAHADRRRPGRAARPNRARDQLYHRVQRRDPPNKIHHPMIITARRTQLARHHRSAVAVLKTLPSRQ